MSEQLKYIVAELNKEPYNKSYNLISFDSLQPIQLHQVLTDVLGEIDPKQKLDVREEAVDQTTFRIFGILRVLKYKAPTDANNLSTFRQGLVQASKPVVYPILEWLIRNTAQLKQRAYLGRYLVKIELPPDMQQDEQIATLFQQYENLLMQFKDSHKSAEQLRNSCYNTTDIKKDISSMENERDQLIKRVDRLKRKVESQPNTDAMLEAARALRMEKDRKVEIQNQKQEQRNVIDTIEKRIQRIENQIRDVRQSSIRATPESLIERLEEQNSSNSFLVEQQMPKDIGKEKKLVQDLQKVISEPAMGQSDLDQLHTQIKSMNGEVNKLIEKRMMSGDPREDKLSLFRQQAAIIVHKKENCAEELREARNEVAQLEAEAEEKRQQVKATDGGEMLKGDEFKRYVNKLRSDNTVYKKNRQILSELRAEMGVLSRTEEILKQRDETINRKLGKVESKKGVAGYRETQEALETISAMKGDMDMMKGQTLEDISYMVKKLNQTIMEKKNNLSPIIKELRPLRIQAAQVQEEYSNRKSSYDTLVAGLESNRSKLEQEVKVYREECSQEESRYHYMKAMCQVLEIQQQRVQAEMKAYTSADQNVKKKAMREQYTRKIQEQENLGKNLRERQKHIREKQDTNMKQMYMWRDVERILQCKIRCAENAGGGMGGGAMMMGGGGGGGGGYAGENRLEL